MSWSQLSAAFKAGLVHSIHKTFEEIPEGICPREEFKELTESLHGRCDGTVRRAN
jgi:hypothetical protein